MRVLLIVILMPSELCFTIYSDAGFFVSADEFLATQEDFPPSMTVLLPLDEQPPLIFFSFCPLIPPLPLPPRLVDALLFALLPPLPQPSGSVQCCAFFNLSITALRELLRFRACWAAIADLLAASACPEGGVLPPLLPADGREETWAASLGGIISSCFSFALDDDDLVLGL